MRYLLAIAVLLASSAYGETTIGDLEESRGTWRAYDGRRYVCSADSEQAMLACAAADAEARRATERYQLRYPNRYVTVTYSAPAPVCGPKPADLTQNGTCPTGTTGSWLQVKTHISAPYPQCWTQSAWTPATPPAGACTPIPPPDADGDGVPDASDQCPSEPANTPDGCPVVEPPPSGSITNLPIVCVAAVTEGAGIRDCPWTDQRFNPANSATLVRHCADTNCTPSTAVWRRWSNVASGYVEVCTVAKLPGDPVAGGNCGADAQGEWGGMAYVAPSQVARTSDTEPPPPADGTTALSWQHSGLKVDGSTADIAGFRVHYGTSPEVLHEVIQLANPGLRAYTVTDLAPGTYYFGVRAYDAVGVESALSNIAQKTVQ